MLTSQSRPLIYCRILRQRLLCRPIQTQFAFRLTFIRLVGVITSTRVMQSVDPVTNGWPQDPLAGFLPPNDASSRREGYVSFLVKPKPELSSGASASFMNQATIVFDFNTPIDTPQVINTINPAKPTSTVSLLPRTSPATFTVSWTGGDPGSLQINSFNIYRIQTAARLLFWLAAGTPPFIHI